MGISRHGYWSGCHFFLQGIFLMQGSGSMSPTFSSVQFSSVQSLSHVWLSATPWIGQASLSITSSRSSLRLTSIESVMPSSHLILCHPLFLLPPIPPSIRVFSNESTLHMRWPKYWSFSFSIISSKEHPGLISFRMDWLDLLVAGRFFFFYHWTHITKIEAAAAAAKSLQSCLTLCDPIDGSPPCSPVPGILQALTLEWVAISFSNAWKWKVKEVSQSCPTLSDPMDSAHQAPPSMGFSRQEYSAIISWIIFEFMYRMCVLSFSECMD